MKQLQPFQVVLLVLGLLLCMGMVGRVNHPKTLGEMLPDVRYWKMVEVYAASASTADAVPGTGFDTCVPEKMQTFWEFLQDLHIQEAERNVRWLPYHHCLYSICINGNCSGTLELEINESGGILHNHSQYVLSKEIDRDCFQGKVDALLQTWKK